jgi:glucokinase
MTALACDIGGTRIKYGIVRDGRILAADTIPSRSDQALVERLPDLADAFRRLCASQAVAIEDCVGLSVSVPSLVDPATGRVLAEYGRFTDMPRLDLPAWAEAEFGLPLAVENDARMATIGEWQYGAGRGCDDLVMITLGTGLGTSAVIQGRVLRGKHGQAGCLGGHLTVRCGGRPCGCGNVGCAEAEASTAFLGDVARSRNDFAASALQREAVLDYAAVFRCAAAGDACATAIRDHSLLVWSSLVVSLIHAYDPELVILGGGIMASAATILPCVQEYVDRHVHTPWGRVRVVASELGDSAALAAAEWLVNEQRIQTSGKTPRGDADGQP